MSESLKGFVTRVGGLLSPETIYRFNSLVNYLEVGRWMKAQGFRPGRRVGRREEIFDRVGSAVAAERVLYLEFGVFRGESIAYWSGLLKHPESRLDGFDS